MRPFCGWRGKHPPQWQNRAHFFGIAAHVMRQILVEYARADSAAKRGGQDLPRSHSMKRWIFRSGLM